MDLDQPFLFWRTPLQTQYAKTLDFESDDCIYNNEKPSIISPLLSKTMTMVLHFERADNHSKQEIVRISAIFDHANQQPVWERLVEILSLFRWPLPNQLLSRK